jgi:hypothetical protein
MSLKLLQPGTQPLGQFDGKDDEYLTLKGGEVVTLVKSLFSANDKAAKDSFDGYVSPASPGRPVVTKTLTDTSRPLFLSDEGITGYGTLFGSVVGGVIGQLTTGQVLGPHTATGSGKVTCWDKPGLYAVSLDAVDTDAADGLTPTNTALTATGLPLYYTSAGLLTPTVSRSALGSGSPTIVARFVDFETNGSLVTSTNSMVTALNSPSGSAAPTKSFNFVVIHFNPAH